MLESKESRDPREVVGSAACVSATGKSIPVSEATVSGSKGRSVDGESISVAEVGIAPALISYELDTAAPAYEA